jgi:phage FluMu protein Com
MKWNFPITKTIRCHKCGKQFDIVLRSKDSKRHPCPHCGQIHTFDFEKAEKTAREEAQKELRKAFRGR